MSEMATNVANATHYGAREAFEEVAQLLARLQAHEIDAFNQVRQLQSQTSSDARKVGYGFEATWRQARFDAFAKLAGELEQLCVQLKIAAPTALRAIQEVRRG